MTTDTRDPALVRSIRRLRYRSRSVAVSVALVAAGVIAVFLGVEAALELAGFPPLLSTVGELWAAAHSAPAVAWGVAGVLAAVGVACVLVAVLPGSLARRSLDDDRLAVVIDDDVVASGMSRAVASAAAVSREQVRTSVGHRTARVELTPSTGFPADHDAASHAANELVQTLGLRPAPAASVAVTRKGSIA